MSETTDLSDDWLERALRDDARTHASAYVADEGFTARVMQRLPAPASVPAWRKRAVAAMWTVAAAGMAVAFPESAVDLVRETFRLFAQPIALPQIGAALLALGGALYAGAAMLLKDD